MVDYCCQNYTLTLILTRLKTKLVLSFFNFRELFRFRNQRQNFAVIKEYFLYVMVSSFDFFAKVINF